MPIATAGFTRFRKHQFVRQAVQGTPEAATRAYALKGTPDVNLNWTDPDTDTGSLDTTQAPYRSASDLTATLTADPLSYNHLPLILSGFFGGGVDPTGGGDAKTWPHAPSSDTVDPVDYFAYEFGDDVTTDWYQFTDGIVESFEIAGPAGLGPCTASMNWRYGDVASTGSTDFPVIGTVPTPGLTVESNPAIVYLKDAGIYIADTVAGLGAGQVTDALYSFTLRGSGDVDQKRFANATQSFAVSAFGRATRMLEYEAVFAKTADIVGTGSESDDWMSETAVDRYLRMIFTSLVLAQSGPIYYSWQFTMPLRYYTRAEGDSGGNTTVTLNGHAFYDGVVPVFDSSAVTTLSAAAFGPAGS